MQAGCCKTAVRHLYICATIPHSTRLTVTQHPGRKLRSSTMLSLKRTRASSQDSSRTQKRSCSNPSYEYPRGLTRYAVPDDSYMSEASEPSPEMLPQHTLGQCVHKQANACSLWMKLCCACADKRPVSKNYLVYIDGIGCGGSQDRSTHYCDGCQGMSNSTRINITTDSRSAAWVSPSTANVSERTWPNPNAPESDGRKRKSSESVEHGSTGPDWRSLELLQPEIALGAIRITCVDRTIDLVRSEYSTYDELREQVAQLLRCDPRELIAIASDIDTALGSEELERGLATFWDRASHIHFRVWPTEDVEMDGT
jgi:hypothetical protein